MSIQGKKKGILRSEYILGLVTPYDIYRKYYGEFKPNIANVNYFRGEKDASLIIGDKYGHWGHFDMADSEWKGGCFDFVQQVFRCSFIDAMKIVDRDFNLGILSGDSTGYKPVIEKKGETTSPNLKMYSTLHVATRAPTNEEFAYWNSYHQGFDDMKRENIFSIKEIFLNRERFYFNKLQLRFGYYYPDLDKWKIYFPFEKADKKWLSNIPLTYLEGKENLVKGKKGWITKSKKDRMVLQKLYEPTCSVQNENKACFSEENVQFIKENSDEQVLFFDADAAGVKNCKIITKEFDMGYCNTPRPYLSDGINDFAELAKDYGMNKVETFLKKKKLL